MKCNRCGTHMYVNRSETSVGSSTRWHKCPLCNTVRLTSTPIYNPVTTPLTAEPYPLSLQADAHSAEGLYPDTMGHELELTEA